MPKRFMATPLAVVAGAGFTLAALHAATPQEGARPAGPPAAPRKGAGPMGPGGPGFGPGNFLAPQVIGAADSDKDGRLSVEEAARAAGRFVLDADEDKKGSIDAGAIARAMNRRMGPPPGFGPGGPPEGPGPGGPPGGFGPGMFLAPQVVELADSDKDGRVSPEEASRAAERLVREADPKAVGSIDADALAGAMNRRMGPPPGFGGPGGPMGAERKLVKDFDKDRDARLNQGERRAARESLKAEREKGPRGGGRGPFGFGPPPGGFPGFGGRDEPAKPGPRVDPAEVKAFPGKKLYDPGVLRTLFLEFEDSDWEAALGEFHGTDVEVPATLAVDGRKYPGVGVHFRGLSSYMAVREGHKRSLNLSLDFVDPKQKLDGYKTLNLLNSHEDPSFLRTVLYLQIAREYIPAPKANFVKLVVNGESWGLYVNAQQFDRALLAENYPDGKGARWKVRGNPGADGGLTYVGDDVEEYKKRYEIKSGDDAGDWKALIALCKALNETPAGRLEEVLGPILDVDGVLRFLALDNALINNDGYWTRASDYSLYRDPSGRFHVLPHDANETFSPAMAFGPRPGGPGGRGPGGPGGGFGMGPRPMGVDLDPLIGLEDPRTPLRGRLLAVPALKSRYLGYVRSIAQDWLDWEKLGPVVARYRELIGGEIEADTRKLTSTAAFREAVADEAKPEATPRGREALGLRAFADRRRRYLLDHPEIQKARP